MKVSKFLLQSTVFALELLFKTSNAKIKINGIDNIPKEQPAMFVINHFTRLETLFLPYIIYKITGKYSVSLAHHSFFVGKFRKILEKVGAVSTKKPDRDKILIKNLLNNKMHIIIFPEGQMIKDKKIIEKGKYMVYNTGIRKSPHTGAARIALEAQFHREVIRCIYKIDNKPGISKYKEYFSLNDDEIDKVITNETYIVPVNITYYPVRAKNNSIKRLVENFIKKISDRYEEELEVEGTMIMDGVDIYINFDNPITVKKYLYKNNKARKLINNPDFLLEKNKIIREIPFRKVGLQLMQKYMTSIYGMTTINHDHIFAYILAAYPGRKICENDFKNRGNLAIKKIKELNLTNFHAALNKNQDSLLTDDFNYNYNIFIEAALSDELICFRDGYLIKNKKKFSFQYRFHDIRKYNIVEVLKNEIEPLKGLIRILRKLMLTPSFWVRRKIRKEFLKIDIEFFNSDFKEFFIPEETKPFYIGAPFFLRRFYNRKGIILIHGYMAAPEEIRPIADFLFKNGYAVYGVRLRGHGTSPEDLSKRPWEEWYGSVNRAYIVMKNSVKEFAVIGFSMGAGLALLQAANKGKKIKGIVSINAPLRLQNKKAHLSSTVLLWNKLLKKIKLEKGQFEFIRNNPQNRHINYFRNPISGVYQLQKLMNRVENKLKDIDIPSLIIQSSDDPVVNPESSKEIFKKIGAEYKEIFNIESNKHEIFRGEESKLLFSKVLTFLDDIFKGKKNNLP